MTALNKKTTARHNSAGFTLMEVMIVVAIVAILTVVAVGSYRNQAVRANRAAAVGFMMEVANKQEQFLLDNRAYAGSLAALGMDPPPDEVDDHYGVTVVAPTATTYTITATPEGAQLSDDTDCGTLTMTQTGSKSASGGGSRCFK